MTIVKLDGEIKLAKYCQWDGYPKGQGAKVAEFIQSKMNVRKFNKAIRSLEIKTPEEIEDMWVECGAERGSDVASFDVSDKVKEKYPAFQRDMGGEILEEIQEGRVTAISEPDVSFLEDSLFCEWAYEIDMDKKKLTVHHGWKERKHDVIPFKDIKAGFQKVIDDYENLD